LFLRAARRAVQGRFTPEIGEHLARVRFGAGIKEDEVGDFLALAAWCLDQVLRTGARGTGKYQVRKCKLCKQPFLATAGANYCHRTAPGDRSRAADSRYLGTPRDHFRLFPTCLDAGSVKDYRARKRAWRLVTGNPVEDATLPRTGQTEMRALSPTDVSRLLSAYQQCELEPPPKTTAADWRQVRRLVTLALSTGLRRGEALALRWSAVELLEGRLTIRETYSRGRFGPAEEQKVVVHDRPRRGRARSALPSSGRRRTTTRVTI
jgi:integrase